MYKFDALNTVFIRSRQNLYYVASEWVQNDENTSICTVTFKLVGGKDNDSNAVYSYEPYDEYPQEQTFTYNFIDYGLIDAIEKFSPCVYADEVEENMELRDQLLLYAKPFLRIDETPVKETE